METGSRLRGYSTEDLNSADTRDALAKTLYDS
jgi:hypothetical protein